MKEREKKQPAPPPPPRTFEEYMFEQEMNRSITSCLFRAGILKPPVKDPAKSE